MQALDDLLAAGQASVDIGLMQVSWRYHRDRLASAALALDPYRNLHVAAEILAACFREREDWWAAVGCYHAPNDPDCGQPTIGSGCAATGSASPTRAEGRGGS